MYAIFIHTSKACFRRCKGPRTATTPAPKGQLAAPPRAETLSNVSFASVKLSFARHVARLPLGKKVIVAGLQYTRGQLV